MKKRFVYRSITFQEEDFEELKEIMNRLKKFENEAELMHTKDMEELEVINNRLKILIDKYEAEFEAHSTTKL